MMRGSATLPARLRARPVPDREKIASVPVPGGLPQGPRALADGCLR